MGLCHRLGQIQRWSVSSASLQLNLPEENLSPFTVHCSRSLRWRLDIRPPDKSPGGQVGIRPMAYFKTHKGLDILCTTTPQQDSFPKATDVSIVTIVQIVTNCMADP